MEINPYVMFGGQCREAFTTYQQVLGGTLQVMTYGEGPPADGPAQPPDHVMHARLEAHGAVLMASDGPAVMRARTTSGSHSPWARWPRPSASSVRWPKAATS